MKHADFYIGLEFLHVSRLNPKAALQSAEARAVVAENQLTVAHKRRLSKQK